jgi:hypothetical protein
MTPTVSGRSDTCARSKAADKAKAEAERKSRRFMGCSFAVVYH